MTANCGRDDDNGSTPVEEATISCLAANFIGIFTGTCDGKALSVTGETSSNGAMNELFTYTFDVRTAVSHTIIANTCALSLGG